MRTREDRCSRFALEIVDRVARIGQTTEGRRLLLDETSNERPVLVERGTGTWAPRSAANAARQKPRSDS
jgi:hypothetical protein